MRHINREDWLSRTMYMVENVMARHGFVDDNLEKRPPRAPADRERGRWMRFLASLLGKQKLGIHFASKPIP